VFEYDTDNNHINNKINEDNLIDKSSSQYNHLQQDLLYVKTKMCTNTNNNTYIFNYCVEKSNLKYRNTPNTMWSR
jgi:hypothetical protein